MIIKLEIKEKGDPNDSVDKWYHNFSSIHDEGLFLLGEGEPEGDDQPHCKGYVEIDFSKANELIKEGKKVKLMVSAECGQIWHKIGEVLSVDENN